MRGLDDEMLEISAATVMSRHEATRDFAVDRCDKTQAGIALEVALRGLSRVGVSEGDAWRSLHQFDDGIVVFDRHCPNRKHLVFLWVRHTVPSE